MTPVRALLSILMLVVAAPALEWTVRAWRGIRARRWPQTVGRITCSNVIAPGTIGARTMRPALADIEYEYRVNDQTLTGTRVGVVGGLGTTAESGYRVVARYPLGKSVVVWYDPDDPGSAVLEPGSAGDVGLAGFLLCLIAGLIWLAA